VHQRTEQAPREGIQSARNEIRGCVRDAGTGRLGGTVEACLTADSKGKVGKAAQATITGEAKEMRWRGPRVRNDDRTDRQRRSDQSCARSPTPACMPKPHDPHDTFAKRKQVTEEDSTRGRGNAPLAVIGAGAARGRHDANVAQSELPRLLAGMAVACFGEG